MGLLDEMPQDGSTSSVENLASRLNADPELVGTERTLSRLFRPTFYVLNTSCRPHYPCLYEHTLILLAVHQPVLP